MKKCTGCGIDVLTYWVNDYKPFCFDCYVPERPKSTFDKLYEFVDYNTTGKPVVIESKSQWRRHLKKLGLHDDVSNSPLKMNDLVQYKEGRYEKEKRRKEYKKVLTQSYLEQRKV